MFEQNTDMVQEEEVDVKNAKKDDKKKDKKGVVEVGVTLAWTKTVFKDDYLQTVDGGNDEAHVADLED